MEWKYYKPKFEYEGIINPYESAWAGHVFFAYDFIRNVKPSRVVELGTHLGHSFFSFCQAAKDEKSDIELNAIDTWKGDDQSGFYGEDVFEAVKKIKSTCYLEQKVNLIRKTFNGALTSFSDKSIDLLHIDGLHTYEAVKHDFDSWSGKVKDDGIILLHDIVVEKGDFGVYKLWDEIKKQYKTLEFFHSNGLGILFKNSSKFINLFDLQEIWQKHYLVMSESEILFPSLINLNNIMKSKEQKIIKKNQEIALMKESRFWKARNIYLKILGKKL